MRHKKVTNTDTQILSVNMYRDTETKTTTTMTKKPNDAQVNGPPWHNELTRMKSGV